MLPYSFVLQVSLFRQVLRNKAFKVFVSQMKRQKCPGNPTTDFTTI